MTRRNGIPSRVRLADLPGPESGGRTRCVRCGVMLPRGVDRPFCVDDSAYARELRARLEQLERAVDAA